MNFFRAIMFATSNLLALGQTAGEINGRLRAEFGLDAGDAEQPSPAIDESEPPPLPAPRTSTRGRTPRG